MILNRCLVSSMPSSVLREAERWLQPVSVRRHASSLRPLMAHRLDCDWISSLAALLFDTQQKSKCTVELAQFHPETKAHPLGAKKRRWKPEHTPADRSMLKCSNGLFVGNHNTSFSRVSDFLKYFCLVDACASGSQNWAGNVHQNGPSWLHEERADDAAGQWR